MLVPGINVIHPLLPGGATASLTSFGFLNDTIPGQTALTPAAVVSPEHGASILVAHATAAAIVAIALPLRRDVT